PEARRLDWAGLVTFSASMFLLVFGLVRGNVNGWSSHTIVSCFAGAALLMLLFVAAELRQQRPMFDLSLFRSPPFLGVSLATFAMGAGMFALLPYITLYLQNELGLSPLQGGLCLLPATVPAFVIPLITRRLTARIPGGVVLGVGLVVTALGVLLMHGLTVASTWAALVAGAAVAGIGIGIANPAMARIALGVVPPQRSGMASGISNTFRLGGVATGVAALGAIFQDRLASSMGNTPPGLGQRVASEGPSAVARGGGHLVMAARQAFVSSTNDLFIVSVFMVMAGAVAALALIGRRAIRPQPVAAAAID
ncbi:MAG: MFS transporter, partial [Candidatus Dormibacteria bacterium]